MHDHPPPTTLQDILNQVVDPDDPLQVGTGVANYRSALRSVTRLPGMPSDLALIPADAARVLLAVQAALDHGSPTLRIPQKALSRLKTLFEKAAITAAPNRLSEWDRLRDILDALADKQGINPKKFTPIIHTLARLACKDKVTPTQVTAAWIASKRQLASAKEAASLGSAARLLDRYRDQLPDGMRPELIGNLPQVAGQRKSGELSAPLARVLALYLAEKRSPKRLLGVDGPVEVTGEGVGEHSATAIRQAILWYHDCLVAVGYVLPASDDDIQCVARLDWLEAVVAESLADLRRDPDKRRLPWKPIGATKVKEHFGRVLQFLCRFAPEIQSDYQVVDRIRATFSDLLDDEMTASNKEFCKKVLRDENNTWLILNMHTILFQEAQDAWREYPRQSAVKQAQTLNLSALAAIAAIETSFPFRARTVLNLSLYGESPDVRLPKKHPGRTEFDVVRTIFKNKKTFDADLEDSDTSKPRAILNWFVAGPREEFLRNSYFLSPGNRKYDLLFAGYDYQRYNQTLQFHSLRHGLRMTTHQWRHALTSILINLEDANIEEIAAVMNISVAVLLRRYAFIRQTLRIARGMRKLDTLRSDLNCRVLASRASALKMRRSHR